MMLRFIVESTAVASLNKLVKLAKVHLCGNGLQTNTLHCCAKKCYVIIRDDFLITGCNVNSTGL